MMSWHVIPSIPGTCSSPYDHHAAASYVTSVDAIVQCIESKFRFLFGLQI